MTETSNDSSKPQGNVERLLKHLKEDSLAARLVHAHGAADRKESMTAVLKGRLEQVRKSLDGTEA